MTLLDRLAVASVRWKKPISVLSAIWLIATVLAHARIIRLPELNFLTGLPATIAASLWNAMWWGWLRPELEKRKAAGASAGIRNG